MLMVMQCCHFPAEYMVDPATIAETAYNSRAVKSKLMGQRGSVDCKLQKICVHKNCR